MKNMKAVSSALTCSHVLVYSPERVAEERELVQGHLKHFGPNDLIYDYDEFGSPYALEHDDGFCSRVGVSDEFYDAYQHVLDEDACTLTERKRFERNLDSLIRIRGLARDYNIEVPS